MIPQWLRDMSWTERAATGTTVAGFSLAMWEIDLNSIWGGITALGFTALVGTAGARERETRLYGPLEGEPNMEGIQEY